MKLSTKKPTNHHNIGYASNPSFFKTKINEITTRLHEINTEEEDKNLVAISETKEEVYQHDREMYEIELEDGSSLLFSPEHKVYGSVVEKELISVSLLIDPIVMVKVLENDYVAFESEGENKASYLNSFEVTQVMPEILESHHLLNSSMVIGLPAGFLLNAFNFLTYSSLKGSSSTGYQSIPSQNSWSSADSSPVLMNSSNMSRFINLTTALANNSASNLGSFFISTSPISITNINVGNEYINNFSFVKQYKSGEQFNFSVRAEAGAEVCERSTGVVVAG